MPGYIADQLRREGYAEHVDPQGKLHQYRMTPDYVESSGGVDILNSRYEPVHMAEAFGRGILPGFDYPVAGAHWAANKIRAALGDERYANIPFEDVLQQYRAEHDRAAEENPAAHAAGSLALIRALPWSEAKGLAGVAARTGQAAALDVAHAVGRGVDAAVATREALSDAPWTAGLDLAAPWVGHLLGHTMPSGPAARASIRGVFNPALVATREEARDLAAEGRRAGGFTWDPARNQAVTHGYALSTRPDLGEIRPEIGAGSLKRYINQRERTFMHDPQAVAGGWRNPETGKWELDVSKVVPDRADALRQAAAAHQKAIYDLQSHETIPVPGSGFQGPVLSPERAAELEAALRHKEVREGTGDRILRAIASHTEEPHMADGGEIPTSDQIKARLADARQRASLPTTTLRDGTVRTSGTLPERTRAAKAQDEIVQGSLERTRRYAQAQGQHLADGGEVTPAPVPTEDLSGISGMAAAPVWPPPATMPATAPETVGTPADRPWWSYIGAGGSGAGGTYGMPPPGPANPIAPPAPMQLMPSHGPGAPTPDPYAVQYPMGPGAAKAFDPFAGILRDMAPPSGAVRDIAAAEKTRSEAEADTARSQAAWAQEQMKWYQDARAKIDTDYNATVADYKAAKIDPNRVFHNRTVGQKVAGFVALLLSGLGSGITGRNPALDMINGFVQRDLEAQVQSLNQKQNLVKMNLDRYGNLDQAVRVSYMQQMAYFEAKIHELTATSNAAQAMPRAQMALYQLRQPLIPIKMQIAQYQGLQNMIRSGGHVVGDMPPPWSWDQYTSLAMPGPGGRTTFARSPEDRKAAVEGLQKWDGYTSAVDQLDAARTGLATMLRPTDAAAAYKQYREAVILQLANAMNVGRGEAFKMVEHLVPDNFDQFYHGDSVNALRDIGANGRWSIWENHGSLHRPQLPRAVR
ncbi:MAG TPA: hypothetical protein VF841_16785 [Anaeromyxobacter sp.]